MPRPGPGMVPVSIRLPLADHAELVRRARANGVTVTQQARADVQAANRASNDEAPPPSHEG